MRLVVIDGQGGGVGKSLVAAVKRLAPEQTVIAVGTNAQATAAMLRAGADMGATGENAIRYQCGRADVIAGVTGLLNASAYVGSALASTGFGALSASGGWTAVLAAWLAISAAGGALCLFSRAQPISRDFGIRES